MKTLENILPSYSILLESLFILLLIVATPLHNGSFPQQLAQLIVNFLKVDCFLFTCVLLKD
jgi:hypothetical protein